MVFMKKIKHPFILVLIVFLIVLSSFNKAYSDEKKWTDKNEINSLSDESQNEIERFINKQIKNGKIPGMAVTIVQGDQTIYQKGFGYANIKNKKLVTSTTLFELSSNSKAFTALGILNLEKQGLIKLDEPVNNYIPWFKMNYKGKNAPITVEQLLYHTSGIPYHTIDKIPESNDDNSLEKTVKTLINKELKSKPGVNFQYATINYDVLGLLIETISGLSYETYMEENIINPLGLNNTYLNNNETISKNMAEGYKLNFLQPQPFHAPVYRGNKPAGYLISNAIDMGKWLKIQLGTIPTGEFSNEIIKKSHISNKGLVQDNSKPAYASGWYTLEKDDTVIYHPGNNPNYSSFIILNPEQKLGIAVLSNINSAYVSATCDGIYGILSGKDYNHSIFDENKIADIISIILIVLSGFILIFALIRIVIVIRQIVRSERIHVVKSKKYRLTVTFSLLFIIVIQYIIHKIPFICTGVSWRFVSVWLPNSVTVAHYFMVIAIWVAYLLFILKNVYRLNKV